MLAGALYAAVGVAVGYSGFEKPGAGPISLLFLIFMIGVLVAGLRSERTLGSLRSATARFPSLTGCMRSQAAEPAR